MARVLFPDGLRFANSEEPPRRALTKKRTSLFGDLMDGFAPEQPPTEPPAPVTPEALALRQRQGQAGTMARDQLAQQEFEDASQRARPAARPFTLAQDFGPAIEEAGRQFVAPPGPPVAQVGPVKFPNPLEPVARVAGLFGAINPAVELAGGVVSAAGVRAELGGRNFAAQLGIQPGDDVGTILGKIRDYQRTRPEAERFITENLALLAVDPAFKGVAEAVKLLGPAASATRRTLGEVAANEVGGSGKRAAKAASEVGVRGKKVVKAASETTTGKPAWPLAASKDTATEQHFQKWLDNTIIPEERGTVENGIKRFVADYPDVVTRGDSWPDIRRMAERSDYISAQVVKPAEAVAAKMTAAQERAATKASYQSSVQKQIANQQETITGRTAMSERLAGTPIEVKPVLTRAEAQKLAKMTDSELAAYNAQVARGQAEMPAPQPTTPAVAPQSSAAAARPATPPAGPAATPPKPLWIENDRPIYAISDNHVVDMDHKARFKDRPYRLHVRRSDERIEYFATLDEAKYRMRNDAPYVPRASRPQPVTKAEAAPAATTPTEAPIRAPAPSAPAGAPTTAATAARPPLAAQAGAVPPAGGQPPIRGAGPTPPGGAVPPTGSVLNRTMQAFQDPPKPPLGQTLAKAGRGFERRFTDEMVYANALGDDVERAVALSRGSAAAGAQRVKDFVEKVNVAGGKAFDRARDYTDSYLHLKHNIDIIAAKGAQRKIAGGIQGEQEARRLLTDMQAELGPQKWAQVENASKSAVAEGRAMLDRMVNDGLVTREMADALKAKYPNYNPTRFIQDVSDMADGLTMPSRLTVNRNNIMRLGEVGSEAGRYRPMDSIMASLMEGENLIARNRAARAIGEAVEAQGIGRRVTTTRPVAQVQGETIFRPQRGDIEGTISYLKDGERVVVEVPPEIERTVKAIRRTPDPEGVARVFQAANQIPRAAFVQYNPTFIPVNFARDVLTATFSKQVNLKYVGKELALSLREALGGPQSAVEREFLLRGGGMSGLYARSPKELADMARREGAYLLDGRNAVQRALANPLRTVFDATLGTVRRVGEEVEQATRTAVFETQAARQGVKFQGGAPVAQRAGVDVGKALDEAALAGRRGTVDFGRMGSTARQLNWMYLFFNPSVQGGLLVGRALRDSAGARGVAAGLVGAAAGLYAYNRQFPEYKDVPADLRYGSIIVMLPSNQIDSRTGRNKARYIVAVPQIRELAVFTGPVTYALESADKSPTADLGKVLTEIFQQSSPFTGPLSIVPTEIGNTAVEQALNRDMFRNRPIVPPELVAKPPAEQFNEFTPEAFVRLGKAFNVSPLRIQHAIESVTGGTGRTVEDIADKVMNAVSPEKPDAEIEKHVAALKAIRPDRIKRNEYLNALASDLQDKVSGREAFLMAKDRPASGIPILGPILARFMGRRGGAVAEAGQARAAAELNLSPEQTAQAGKAIGDVSRKLSDQQMRDTQLVQQGRIDGKEWKARHSDLGTEYRGALTAIGLQFPGAAQAAPDRVTYRDWLSKVNTVADAMLDRRQRGQVLASAFSAIDLPEDDAGNKDFRTFYELRDAFKASLSGDDREALDAELNSRRDPVERAWNTSQEQLRGYWEAGRDRLQPMQRALLDEHDSAEPKRKTEIEKSPAWKFIDKQVGASRKETRAKNADIDLALHFFYGYTLSNTKNLDLARAGKLEFAGVKVPYTAPASSGDTLTFPKLAPLAPIQKRPRLQFALPGKTYKKPTFASP